MRNLLWLVPVAVFFLNPNLACSDEPQYQYGADEMRAAVEGDWSLTITPDGGSASQVTVHIEQSPASLAARRPARAFVRAAEACGTRTLVKSAGACIDVTEMPLAVTYISGDPAFSSAANSGSFSVFGLAFAIGDLNLKVGAYQIRVTVHADGTLEPATVYGSPTGTVAVTR